MQMSASEAEQTIRSAVGALQQGRPNEARRLLQGVTERGSPLPPPWLLLAQACHLAGDRSASEVALDRLLDSEPRNIAALIMKGDLRAAAGDARAALSFYTTALAAADRIDSIPPALARELERARAFSNNAKSGFERHLEAHLERAGVNPSAAGRRFEVALDLLLGRKEVYLQQPNSFYYPFLPQIQFYERAAFPCLAQIEAAVPAIQKELEGVLAEDGSFAPYVEVNPDRPQPANHLLGDPSWGAFYLWKAGEMVAENAARCPRTIEALRAAPMPRIGGRSPMALFSLLRPGTHIKPHHGLINTRLICHIPLVVPPGCGLRVGNEVREWETGKALIFDDSIEHEAWNRGSETRVVLLFEIWRPEIDEAERHALTAMFEAITELKGSQGASA